MDSTSNRAGEIAGAFGEFIANVRFDDLSSTTRHAALRCLLDQLGCALFGSTLPWNSIVRDYVAQQASPAAGLPTATIWGSTQRASVLGTALANGTAGHSFEIDDLHTAGCIHPGAVTIPAALAVGEQFPERTATDILTAIVCGYEVAIRIGTVLGIPHFLRGFHPQGTVGGFAAAAAAAKLLGLDANQSAEAIALVASSGAGLMAAQEGGMVKRLHSGRACAAGVEAAYLAQLGFTGAKGAIEAPFGSFFHCFAGREVDASEAVAGLRETWETDNVGFKAYASCATVHTSLDLSRQLSAASDFDLAKIHEIRAYVSSDAHLHSGYTYVPQDAMAAQMSIQYGVAAMLLDHEVGAKQFEPARLTDTSMVELAHKVKVIGDSKIDALGYSQRFAARMEIDLAGGKTLRGSTLHRRGEAPLELTDDELVEKYRSLTSALPCFNADALLDAVWGFEHLPNAQALTQLLAMPVPQH